MKDRRDGLLAPVSMSWLQEKGCQVPSQDFQANVSASRTGSSKMMVNECERAVPGLERSRRLETLSSSLAQKISLAKHL